MSKNDKNFGQIRSGIVFATAISFLLVVSGLAVWRGVQKLSSASPSPSVVACTEEVKICPDGSSVGRTGPNCEFAPCLALLKTGEEVTLKGQVTYIDRSQMAVDGPGILRMRLEGGTEVQASVPPGESACGNELAIYSIYNQLVVGKNVEVFGRVNAEGGIDLCGKAYYLRVFIDEAAGWKTYRNTKYGFKFQYPDGEIRGFDWNSSDEVLVTEANRIFIEKDQPRSYVTIEVDAFMGLLGQENLKAFAQQEFQRQGGSGQVEEVNINGNRGYQFVTSGHQFISLERSGVVYKIRIPTNNQKALSIIQTFEFTN